MVSRKQQDMTSVPPVHTEPECHKETWMGQSAAEWTGQLLLPPSMFL